MADIARKFTDGLIALGTLNDSQVKAAVKVLVGILAEKHHMQAVKYIGPRPVYEDAKFKTGRWNKDQVKLVPGDAARKMVGKYSGVYVVADGEEVSAVVGADTVVQARRSGLDKSGEALLEFSNILQGMNDTEQIRQFARERLIGFEIDARIKNVDKLREAVEIQARISLPS